MSELSPLKAFAKFISYVFHPLFMPLLAIVLVFNTPTGINHFTHEEVKMLTYKVLFLMTVAMPGLSMLILKQSKLINSLQMETKEERILPFLVQLFYFLLTYFLIRYFTYNFHFPEILYSAFTGAILALACVIIITFRWKVSIHMMGLGGIVGVILAVAEVESFNGFLLVSGAILAAGITGTARLILGAHSTNQVYAGFFIGAVFEYFVIKWGFFF